MQTLNRAGVNLAYTDAGKGGPPLLLVHGFCGNQSHLSPQFDYFRRHHRVVAVDRRGHGQSDKPEQEYTIEGFADDLAWLCREIGLYKPVVVVHSMGAIGLELAARYPDLPSGLVLLDAPFAPPAEVAMGFQQLLGALAGPAYREVLCQTADGLIFRPTDDRQRKEKIVEEMQQTPQHVIVSSWKNFLSYDEEAAAAQCRQPLLYLHSHFPANLSRLRELCPQLVTGETVGAGHFHQLEVADQVNPMIERFIHTFLPGGER